MQYLEYKQQKEEQNNGPAPMPIDNTIQPDQIQHKGKFIDLRTDFELNQILREKRNSETIAKFLKEKKNCQILNKGEKHIIFLQRTIQAPIIYVLYINTFKGEMNWAIIQLKTTKFSNCYRVSFSNNNSINGWLLKDDLFFDLIKDDETDEYIVLFIFTVFCNFLELVGYHEKEKNSIIQNGTIHTTNCLNEKSFESISFDVIKVSPLDPGIDEDYFYDMKNYFFYDDKEDKYVIKPVLFELATGGIFLYGEIFQEDRCDEWIKIIDVNIDIFKIENCKIFNRQINRQETVEDGEEEKYKYDFSQEGNFGIIQDAK